MLREVFGDVVFDGLDGTEAGQGIARRFGFVKTVVWVVNFCKLNHPMPARPSSVRHFACAKLAMDSDDCVNVSGDEFAYASASPNIIDANDARANLGP